MRARALLALLLAVPAAAAPAAAPSPSPFEARAPKGWKSAPSDGGLTMTGPAAEAGLKPLISVRYYRPGDKTFPTLADFVKRQTEPGPFPSSPKASVSELVVAGRKATGVERLDSEFVPPRSRASKEIAVRERAVAVPGEAGFYVLTLRAPRSADKKSAAAFEAVLKTFKPNK